MAKDIARTANDLREIGSHIFIGLTVIPRALPVITHINSNDRPAGRKPLGKYPPIPRRTKKPMGDQKRHIAGTIIENRVQHASLVPLKRGVGPEGLSALTITPKRASMGKDIHQQVAALQASLEEKLGVRGRTLQAQLRKAGRRLPRHVRRDATYVAQSVALADNPKLARMVDEARMMRAHKNVMAHLNTINVTERRVTAALNLIASIAFVLLVTAALVLFVLVQRGLV